MSILKTRKHPKAAFNCFQAAERKWNGGGSEGLSSNPDGSQASFFFFIKTSYCCLGDIIIDSNFSICRIIELEILIGTSQCANNSSVVAEQLCYGIQKKSSWKVLQFCSFLLNRFWKAAFRTSAAVARRWLPAAPTGLREPGDEVVLLPLGFQLSVTRMWSLAI